MYVAHQQLSVTINAFNAGAIHHHKEELVDLLLERGSNPYKKNILSVSPLALAPEADKRRIAEIWKARRARVRPSIDQNPSNLFIKTTAPNCANKRT